MLPLTRFQAALSPQTLAPTLVLYSLVPSLFDACHASENPLRRGHPALRSGAWRNYVRRRACLEIYAPSNRERSLPKEGETNVLITSALPYCNNVPHLGTLLRQRIHPARLLTRMTHRQRYWKHTECRCVCAVRHSLILALTGFLTVRVH